MRCCCNKITKTEEVRKDSFGAQSWRWWIPKAWCLYLLSFWRGCSVHSRKIDRGNREGEGQGPSVAAHLHGNQIQSSDTHLTPAKRHQHVLHIHTSQWHPTGDRVTRELRNPKKHVCKDLPTNLSNSFFIHTSLVLTYLFVFQAQKLKAYHFCSFPASKFHHEHLPLMERMLT